MKHLSYLIIAMAFFLFFQTPSQASPTKRLDPGTQICRIFSQVTLWDGYQIFKNNCKTCHAKNNNQNAPFIHSESKIMRAWNRVFLKRYPKCAKTGKWDHLDSEQLMRLNDYLFRNAADSYDPYDAADCG